MKKTRRKILILLVLGFCFAWSAGRAEPQWVNKHSQSFFGTVSSLRVWAEPEEAERIWAEVREVLGEIEQNVSVSVPESDVSRFNALPGGSRMTVSPLTAEIVGRARALYALSEGRYDPTVFPLVDLWGFSPRFNTRAYQPALPYDREKTDGQIPMPDPVWIERLLPLVGFDGVSLEAEDGAWVLVKGIPDVSVDGRAYAAQIDLGGIAKGYACDRVRDILTQHGCTEGYFSCGGSSIAVLGNAAAADGRFEVTLQKPREGTGPNAWYGKIRVADVCLSTSNDVSQCWRYDGAVYSHLIDPATGWPVNTSPAGETYGIISVTLFAPRADACDALTTGLMLMGVEPAGEWLDSHPDYAAIIVSTSDSGLQVREYLPEGWETTDRDPAYHWLP